MKKTTPPTKERLEKAKKIAIEQLKNKNVEDFLLLSFKPSEDPDLFLTAPSEHSFILFKMFFATYPNILNFILTESGFFMTDHIKFLIFRLYEHMKANGYSKEEMMQEIIFENKSEYLQKILFQEWIDEFEEHPENKE